MSNYIIGLDGQRRLKPGVKLPLPPKPPKPPPEIKAKPPRVRKKRAQPRLPAKPPGVRGKPVKPENDLTCPECKGATKVVDSRSTEYGRVRYRKCEHGHKFRTTEILADNYARLLRVQDFVCQAVAFAEPNRTNDGNYP